MAQRIKRLRDIPIEDVVRLYRDESWTAERIAKKYGIVTTTVFTWLKRAGVPRRIAARQAFNADPEHIKDLYHRQNLSPKKIGELFGIDDNTVLRFLARHDIPRRPRGRFSKRDQS